MWPLCRLCAGWFCRPSVVREATWGSCWAAWLGVGSEWGSLVCECFLALLLQPRLPGMGWAAQCACSFSCFNHLLPKPDLEGSTLSSNIAVPHYLCIFSVDCPACIHCHILLVVLPIQAAQPCIQAHMCVQEHPTLSTIPLEWQVPQHFAGSAVSLVGSPGCTCSPMNTLSWVLLHPLNQFLGGGTLFIHAIVHSYSCWI